MKAQIIVFLLGVSLGTNAQVLRYMNEVMTQEDAASEVWVEAYEQLCEMEQHPLDINSATREQLEALPFLSSQQVEELMEYRDRYGAMKSLGELLMIRSLDYTQRRMLSHFVYVGEEPERGFPSLPDVAKYGHHELMATARIPFYKRKGDHDGYLGYPYRHWLRYQFTYGDDVKLGLVGAQDAGEPFFANRNKWGYDYYSFYLQLRNLGRLESLCLGNYRVSMGMGLVTNSDFTLGKLAMLQNMGRAASGIRAHSSRSNTSLLGVASTMNLGRGFHLTTFASYRPMDATLNKDSTVSTILTTDYHRTESEMSKKHNLNVMKTGGSLRYVKHGIHLGVNALYVHLDKPLKPNTSILYRRHDPQGHDFFNASLDYGYAHHRFSFQGETALDKHGHLATINSTHLRLGNALNIMALQRFYSYRYTSIDAQSYSDGGKVKNESGLYLGLSWQPLPTFRLVAYTDYALKRFFETASRQPWFQNTLFVITADHVSQQIDPFYRTTLGNYCVPIILYAPGDASLHGYDEQQVVEQIDIMPTVLSYLHYDKPYIAFGRDMLSPGDGFALHWLPESGSYEYVRGDYALEFDGRQVTAAYQFRTDSTLSHNVLGTMPPTTRESMERHMKSIIQQYMQRMTTDRLTIGR